MSIRYQVAGLLLVLSIILSATTYAVQTWVVMPAFVELERQSALRNVARCTDALHHDIETISNLANDWGAWDDSYAYVQDHNEEFAKCNLVDEAFSNSHINLICYLDTEHRIVWGEARDMESLELIEVPDLFKQLRDATGPWLRHKNAEDAKVGVVLTSRGPMLLASRPIVTTKRAGPIRGAVVMGRFLSPAEVANLADRTHLALEVWSLDRPGTLPPDAQRQVARCTHSGHSVVEPDDDETLFAYSVMNDAYGQPALLMRVRVPRDVTAQGRVSANVATGCGIAGSVLTLFVMWCALQWRVLGPLRRMASHALRVGQQDDLKARLDLQRRDEIGTLASEFDAMVARLAETRNKVLDSAHRAGMAEIASEVLHNVGNAVNSANCSIEMLEERLDQSKLAGLQRATALLAEQSPHAAEFFAHDPRAPKLIEYFSGLRDALDREHTENRADVARLRDVVRHIREAIASQQDYAGRSDFRQDVDLAALIDETLELNRELIRSAEVQVTVDVPPLPEVQLNKSKLTQVLVNLVRNAIQAMLDQPSDCRQLTITARCMDGDGLGLEVSDTGSGFGEEVRDKLFTHGFTTKAEGNGFGLHFCANAVREVGGHMAASSAGPGQGATFRIGLPHVLPAAMANV